MKSGICSTSVLKVITLVVSLPITVLNLASGDATLPLTDLAFSEDYLPVIFVFLVDY